MNGVLQTGNVTPGHLAAWATDGVIEDAGFTYANVNGRFVSTLQGVNFNAANTDFPVNINLPVGFTRYRVASVMVSGASATLTTATVGVFTAGGGNGVAVVAGSTSMTISATTIDTVNNMQVLTIANQNLIAFSDPVLFFRVQTAQGSAATATVSIFYEPLP